MAEIGVWETGAVVRVGMVKFAAYVLVTAVLGLAVSPGVADAQSSRIIFCNKGEGDMLYRKIVLGRTSASRSEVVLRPGKCGPDERSFPAAYAFFSRDDDGVEHNVVYENPADRIEGPENLRIERACFNPHNRSREVVSRAYADEFWLGDECRPGQRMARVTFVVLVIRGNGTMTYNLAKPEILWGSVWFEAGAKASGKRPSDFPAETFDPSDVLLRPFLGSGGVPASLRTLDNIAIADLPREMSLSPKSNREVSVMIDGRFYGLPELVDIARKMLVQDLKDVEERDLYHIHNRPLLLRTDDGGHAVIYADMRRKTLIVGAVEPGALDSHVSEYGEKDPLLTEFFASSYFTDRDFGFWFKGTSKDFVEWKRGGLPGVFVSNLVDNNK